MTRHDDPAAPLVLYLVRHGLTRLNAEHRVQGWADSELTDDGLAGVRATAETLRDVGFVAAYASPSGRTVTTAREILRRHRDVTLTTDERLRELGFGDYEEQPEHSLARFGDAATTFRAIFDGTFPGFPGGEPGTAYLSRVAGAFRDIEQAGRLGGAVLVVSHGITLMAYLRMVGAMPVAPLANAGVSTVRVDPDGTRTVLTVGTAPPGQVGADVEQEAARAGLERAATELPDSGRAV